MDAAAKGGGQEAKQPLGPQRGAGGDARAWRHGGRRCVRFARGARRPQGHCGGKRANRKGPGEERPRLCWDCVANRTAEDGGPRSGDGAGRGPPGEAGKVWIFFRSERHRRPPARPPRSGDGVGRGAGTGANATKNSTLKLTRQP